jgi:flagellar motility protein MotE (MotC chaperone)
MILKKLVMKNINHNYILSQISSSETSSEISSLDEKEKQIVVLDENVKYIIDEFKKRKEELEKEEKELIKRFPDYF